MADEHNSELTEIEEPDDPDAVDLEALEEDLGDDEPDDLDDDLVEVVGAEDAIIDDVDAVEIPVASPGAEVEDDDEDDDEDVDLDEVEAGLDVILKDRLVVEDEVEDEEEDEAPDTDERAEGSVKVLPKRPEEFVCQSCFLVKHPTQLADDRRMLCLDCV